MAYDCRPIRDAIVAQLNSIDNIGVVRAYERYASTSQDLAAMYTVADGGIQTLRGWFVQRVSANQKSPANGISVEKLTWRIRGLMAIVDSAASELVFDQLIDAIRDAFDAIDSLGGANLHADDDTESGVQLRECGPANFCGVLCHAATLELTTTRYFHL